MFIPDWAEKALQKPTAFDAAELSLLREFYDAWIHLHALQKDKAHRKKLEEASADLLDKAKKLRYMRGVERPMVINGHAVTND